MVSPYFFRWDEEMSIVLHNLNDLKKYIETTVNIAIEEEVVPEIQADLAENAEADVYGAYDPYMYERAWSLMNSSTYPVEYGNMNATISVDHKHGKLIEYGQGGVDDDYYEYPYNRDDTAWKFLNPRPFYRHTIETLEDGRFKELCKKAFKKCGLNVH